jgi:hypothetical protein
MLYLLMVINNLRSSLCTFVIKCSYDWDSVGCGSIWTEIFRIVTLYMCKYMLDFHQRYRFLLPTTSGEQVYNKYDKFVATLCVRHFI